MIRIVQLAALAWCFTIHASHTFFVPRQITTDPTFELALTDYNIYHERDAYRVKPPSAQPPLEKTIFERAYDWFARYILLIKPESRANKQSGKEVHPLEADTHKFQLYLKPFVQHSAFPEKAATFFLPNCKSCVSVREDGTGDINPLWFGVIAPSGTFYSSTYSVRPRRVTTGGVITFYANLTHRLWLLLNTTAMAALHSLQAEETNRNSSGTMSGFANMCEALDNPILRAGKIPCCKTLLKGGLDDIQIKLGYDFFRKERGHFAAYAVGTIPTGEKATSEFLFEPLVGSRHGSLGGGINFDWVMLNRDRYKMTLLADAKYRYVFKGTECRSFDLCPNGDWSRYLLVAKQSAPFTALPGINFFTMPVEVTPRSTIDAWLALNQKIHNWNVEVGYTLWWREKEHLEFDCETQPFCGNTIGIFNMAGLCDCSGGTANSATINQSIANDTVTGNGSFIPLTQSNLNLDSAAHPNTLSNKLYLASAYNLYRNRTSWLFGLGGSYEIAANNAALNQWALWVTLGCAF